MDTTEQGTEYNWKKWMGSYGVWRMGEITLVHRDTHKNLLAIAASFAPWLALFADH